MRWVDIFGWGALVTVGRHTCHSCGHRQTCAILLVGGGVLGASQSTLQRWIALAFVPPAPISAASPPTHMRCSLLSSPPHTHSDCSLCRLLDVYSCVSHCVLCCACACSCPSGQELLASYERTSADFWEACRGNVQLHAYVSTLADKDQVCYCVCGGGTQGLCVWWWGGDGGVLGQPAAACLCQHTG